MYEVKSRVRLSEVSDNGCMTLPGIINSFQDASIFQSEDLGVGTKYLEEQKKAWVLSSWQVEILRYPKLGEEIRTCTWATGFHGFFGDRNFVMKDQNGEVTAYANSIWVYRIWHQDVLPDLPKRRSVDTGWKSRIPWNMHHGKCRCRKEEKKFPRSKSESTISTRTITSIIVSTCRWRWNFWKKTGWSRLFQACG